MLGKQGDRSHAELIVPVIVLTFKKICIYIYFQSTTWALTEPNSERDKGFEKCLHAFGKSEAHILKWGI